MITTNKFQALLGKAVSYFILLSCLAILMIYLVQRFGGDYAEQKIKEQLERSGLAPFVHYENIHLDPFTLTPSLENVIVGDQSAPWLRFARISLNNYLINYPNLSVDFWIQESPINSLSRDTGRLMRAAGIDTLLGKGSFSSNVDGESVTSQFKLDIKDLGKLTVASHINLLDQAIDMADLRADILASLALGQPEALAIIYGDAIELNSLNVQYQDTGLFTHLFPHSTMSQDSQNSHLTGLKFASQAFGLAPADSSEADHIAKTVLTFLNNPNQLSLSMSPSPAMSLKKLTLLANEGSLYQDTTMRIAND